MTDELSRRTGEISAEKLALLVLRTKKVVPSVLLELSELPLTPNGKVDRSALPAPEGNRLDTRETLAHGGQL